MGFWFWVLLFSVIFLPTLGCVFASTAYRYLGVLSLLAWGGLLLWACKEYFSWKHHDDGQF